MKKKYFSKKLFAILALVLFTAGFLNLPVAQAATITSPLSATGSVGARFNYQITQNILPDCSSCMTFIVTGLPPGLSVDTTGMISGVPTSVGTSSITLAAYPPAGFGGGVTATLTLTINPLIPVITSSSDASGNASVAFSYQITANNSPTSFSATGLPTGLSVNTTSGLISGIITTTGTFNNITVSASSAGGTSTATAALTITINPPPPVITSPLTATGQVGAKFFYQITATNGPFRLFSASGLPGLSVDVFTGLISGTPTQAGTFSFLIKANNNGGSGTALVTLTVTGVSIPDTPPTAPTNLKVISTGFSNVELSWSQSTDNVSVDRYKVFRDSIFIGDVSNTTISSPSSLVFYSEGNLSPDRVYSYKVSAVDVAGNESGTSNVVTATTQSPSTFTSPPVIESFSHNNSNGINAPITFGQSTSLSSKVTGTPSPTVTINNGVGAVSGVGASFNVTVSPTVTTTYILTATNSAGTITSSLTVVVNPSSLPVIALASLSRIVVQVGMPFTRQITATNNPTFSATGLPAGFSINSTGLISGTPTFPVESVATLNVVNSSGSGTAPIVFSIIPPLPPSPVITSSTTATGRVGVKFIYQITATNNPNRFNAIGLPAGLSVNMDTGLIFGTPIVSGTFNVTIKAFNAFDSEGGSVNLALTIPRMINSCQEITKSGSYLLSSDISVSQSSGSCLNIHDVSDINIDCDNHKIQSAISPTSDRSQTTIVKFTNATNFSLVNCNIKSQAFLGGRANQVPLEVLTSSSGTIKRNIIESSFILIKGSNNIDFTNNQVITPLIQVDSGSFITIADNTINALPVIGGSFNILLDSGHDNTVARNVLDGKWDGVFNGLNSIGNDAGIIFQDESNDLISNNTISNVWNAGIETDGLVQNSIILGNRINKAGIAGIEGVHHSNLKGLSFLDNIIDTAPKMFFFQLGGAVEGLRPKDNFLFFLDNKFISNKFINPTAASGQNASSITVSPTNPTINVIAGDRRITLADIKAGNNTFANNDFGTQLDAPWPLLPTNIIVDGGGNVCGSIPSFIANYPLICNKQSSSNNTSVPVIGSPGGAMGIVGVPFKYQVKTTNNPTSFSATGLPSGLSINTTTGLISGTPIVSGTFVVTLKATNWSGTGVYTWVLTVKPAGSTATTPFQSSDENTSNTTVLSNNSVSTKNINTRNKVEVKNLQTTLNDALDLNLKVDGIFGKATKNAVRTFQRANNLKIDGIIGPKTKARLGL